jgi:glycosyltransferase involved in cell wall biosynthesis
MNVLFTTYPMAFHTPGGGEIQLLKYFEQLNTTEVNITLFNQWDPKFLEHDIVHFFSCIGGSVHFCAYIKKIGLSLVVSPNLWIIEDAKHLYPFDEIRNIFVMADIVIGNSDAEGNLMASVFNIPRDKFVTVYNGVDESFFDDISAELFKKQFDFYDPFILNVANIEPRKNQLRLIQAMKHFPQLKLVLIGHIRDEQYAQQCFDAGGDQVHYLGALPHDSLLLRSAYKACELFALPSTLETPGLAALEAAATGAKILITSEGCTNEYFGQGVIYIDPNSEESIKNGIADSIIANRNSLLKLAVNANFTWKHVISNLLAHYKAVLGNNNTDQVTNGFHPIECDPNGNYYMWSKEQVDFSLENGQFGFLWHSLEGAIVDIIVNNEIIHKDISVNSEWTHFNLDLHNSTHQTNHISIRVKNITRELTKADPRILGVAFRDVIFNLEQKEKN